MKRISPATAISLVALFFSLGGVALASNGTVTGTGTIRATKLTSRFNFHALPRRVETECEPTSAKAVLLGGRRTHLPVLLENRANNGSVYIFERGNSTCAAVVNWTAHREIVHFAVTLLDTTTRL